MTPTPEGRALVEKWRDEATKIAAFTTAPCGLTWDHGATDALRRCADELEAALAAMQQPASGDLERWGKAPEGSPFLLQPMADGYWAPWHVAAAQLAAKDREIERIEQLLVIFSKDKRRVDGLIEAAEQRADAAMGLLRSFRRFYILSPEHSAAIDALAGGAAEVKS